MCSKPVLDCIHFEKAGKFDWDFGWFLCQRKEFYNVNQDAWMGHTNGGPLPYRQAQEQNYRDQYAAFSDERKSKKGKASRA